MRGDRRRRVHARERHKHRSRAAMKTVVSPSPFLPTAAVAFVLKLHILQRRRLSCSLRQSVSSLGAKTQTALLKKNKCHCNCFFIVIFFYVFDAC